MKKRDKQEFDFIVSQAKKVFIGIAILTAALLILAIILL
jgi:hypothetical protein